MWVNKNHMLCKICKIFHLNICIFTFIVLLAHLPHCFTGVFLLSPARKSIVHTYILKTMKSKECLAWRNDSVVGSWVQTLAPTLDGSQPLETPALWYLVYSTGFHGYVCMHTHAYAHTDTHRNKNNINYEMKNKENNQQRNNNVMNNIFTTGFLGSHFYMIFIWG